MLNNRNFFLKSLLLLTICLPAVSILSAAPQYDYAIEWAREGKMEKSIKTLGDLVKKYPGDKNLFYDYITVLSWAQKDTDVLRLAKRVDFDAAPAYLIQSVAKSARNLKRYTQSAKLYVKGAKRFPDNFQFYQGLALVLSDMKRFKLAERVLEKAVLKFPENTRIKFTQATIYETQKRYFDAMVIYQKLLLNPEVKDKAVVRLVGTLRKQAMPWLAQKYISQNPELFDKETKYAVLSDQAAFELRWGTKGYHRDGDYSYINDALEKIDEVIKKLQKKDLPLLENKRLQNAWFDKMIALDTMGDTDGVIKIYGYLKNAGVDMPYNILNIAADAYLDKKEPETAREIIFESLGKNPGFFETKVLLFYSYSDNYDMHEAMDLADWMDSEQPARIWDKNHLHKIENPRKTETILLKTLSYEYSGYMNYSQKRLEDLVLRAPANIAYRIALAKLYYYRGLMEKAKEQYEIVLAMNPSNFDARAGKILIAIKQKRYESADWDLKELSLKYGYKKRDLKELRKTLQQESKNRFFIRSSYGGNLDSSNRGGSHDYFVEADYYSSLIDYRYRVSAFTRLSRNSFYSYLLNNRRYGVGVKYENNDFSAEAKLAYNETYISSLAPSIDLGWQVNDSIRVWTKGAWFCDSTPLRALAYGIRADQYKIGIEYGYDESASTSLEYERMSFSDRNKRDTLSLTQYLKLVEGPYYNLDSYLYAGGMRNSSGAQTVYYNPGEDYYISLEAKNIWNLYNFYDFYIKQIIGVEIGTHLERDYDAKTTGALLLSQEWGINEDFGFDFGFIRKRSSYDGEIEYADKLFLNINGSF